VLLNVLGLNDDLPGLDVVVVLSRGRRIGRGREKRSERIATAEEQQQDQ
jgi:hypothetical protein